MFQVPVVYHRTAGEGWIRVGVGGEGRPGDRLDHAASRALFERRGTVARIDVGIPEDSLLD